MVKCVNCRKGKIVYDHDFYSGAGIEFDICNIRCNNCGRLYTYDEAVRIERKQKNDNSSD